MPRRTTIYSKKRAGRDDAAKKPQVSWRDRPTLRIMEVAGLIGVSQDSVQKLIKSGNLVVRHAGRIPVIVTSSLLDWVDGNSSSNPSTLVTPLRVSAKHRAEADRLMKRSTRKNPQSNKEK